MSTDQPTSRVPPVVPWNQRWLVAQRLAQGDGVEQAAGWAGVPADAVAELQADAAFREQVRAEAAVLALSDAAWAERLKGQMRQAVERALAEGKVSTVNVLLRASLVLPMVSAAGISGRGAQSHSLARLDAAVELDAEPATPPPVDPDHEREARRQAILAQVAPALRPGLDGAGLELLEQLAAATDPDPAVYESWFAAQPKPEAATMPLPAEDQAAIRHVTRHNPPWLRGEHLSFHRAPVPAEAFGIDARGTIATSTPPPDVLAPVPAEPVDPLPTLRRRLERLIDRAVPRTADELDLAEAVCAVRWPNWPRYAGPTDLPLLRRALADRPIDDDTLHWLGSRELAEACRAAAPREPPG